MAAINPPTAKNLADYSTLLANLGAQASLLSQGAKNWSTLGDFIPASFPPDLVALLKGRPAKMPTVDWLTQIATKLRTAVPTQTQFEVDVLDPLATLFEQWAAEEGASASGGVLVASINAGGGAITDSSGHWDADEFETGGATADWTGHPTTTTVGDSAIFDSERAGTGHGPTDGFQYNIPVPAPGPYVFSIWMVEHYVPAQVKNIRRTDVFFGNRSTGSKVINGLDSFYYANAAYGDGADRAFVVERNVLVTGATLDLDFAPGTGTTVAPGSLAGIRVRSGSDAQADLAALNDGSSQSIYGGTRVKTEEPYDRFSPCNVPIGSSAVYQPSGITAPTALNGSAKVYPDPINMIPAASGDGTATVTNPAAFNNRDGLNPTITFTPVVNGTLTHFPQTYVIADATTNEQPNEVSDIIMPDLATVQRINGVCHVSNGAPVFGYNYGSFQQGLLTDQFPRGGHASQLNGIGHAVRSIDFTRPGIRHALGLSLCGARNYKWGGSLATSYVWPAISCDAYAGTAWTATGSGTSPPNTHYSFVYGSLNPALPAYMMIGALLALHPSKVYSDFAVTTDFGKLIFDALQNHGGYALDDSAGFDFWNVGNITVRKDAMTAMNAYGGTGMSQTVRDEIARMMGGLMVITNNSPTSIGGGGVPRVPLVADYA